jgi:hypothetical protein
VAPGRGTAATMTPTLASAAITCRSKAASSDRRVQLPAGRARQPLAGEREQETGGALAAYSQDELRLGKELVRRPRAEIPAKHRHEIVRRPLASRGSFAPDERQHPLVGRRVGPIDSAKRNAEPRFGQRIRCTCRLGLFVRA